MVGIINYNIGNLASVYNAFKKVGTDTRIEREASRIFSYDRLVLPGVGAFGDAMAHLKESGMAEALLEYAKSGRPILGICLGMQLLFERSYEFGEHEGLGLIKGDVVAFDKAMLNSGEKIPHMGWNRFLVSKHSALFNGLGDEFYLYFVHSFHAQVKNPNDVLGVCEYGYKFVSAIERENLYGFQPHPEKSHENGLRILKNFCEI